MNDSEGTGTITDRKERGQRDQIEGQGRGRYIGTRTGTGT